MEELELEFDGGYVRGKQEEAVAIIWGDGINIRVDTREKFQDPKPIAEKVVRAYNSFDANVALIAQLAEALEANFTLVCRKYCDCGHFKLCGHDKKCLHYQELIRKAKEARG